MIECGPVTSIDLMPCTTNKSIILDFHELTYRQGQKRKLILNNVSGQFQTGKFSAIIGPSGAGKTSLVNILSGFKDTGVEGSILINGQPRKSNQFRQISSYIPQEFVMLDKLTTIETLNCSADFKLGLKTKRNVKKEIVENIINILNLEKCRNTLVKKLSGGERKRLSIGIELITNPPVMFFDEPTSGLDTVSSLQVLTYLRKLAKDGRAIICVVHQPSSRVLQLFDEILVLSEGECIYNGPVDQMVDSFKVANFICPQYYNPADFAIEVASKEHGPDLKELKLVNEKKFIANEFEINNGKSEESKLLNGRNSYHLSKDTNHNLETYYRRYPVNFFEQISILVTRNLRAMSRDLLCVQLRIVVHALVALFIGMVYYDVGKDISKIYSNNSCIFFFLMFLFLGNGMPTVLQVPLEVTVFLREYLNSWYSLPAYYCGKLIADLPLIFLCPTVFISIAYYMTGQPMDFGRFLMCWGICLLMCILGHSFGGFAGAAAGLQMAVFIVPATCIPMLMLGGFFIRYEELSDYLRPLSYISYFRYPFEGAMQSIYGYNRTDIECSEIICYFPTPEKFLKYMSMDGDRYGYDVLGLGVWIIFFQICLFLSLIWKVKKVQ